MNPGRLAIAAMVLRVFAPAGVADTTDRESLQGSWSVVSAKRNGQEAKDVLDHVFIMKGDSFSIRSKGDTIYEGSVAIDPARNPREIDFTHKDGALKDKTWRGIYKLDGDTLSICDNAVDLEKPRPKDFDATPGSGYVFVVFKRAKP